MTGQPYRHITVRPLHPLFAAEVTGIDLTQPLPDDVFAEVAAAFDEHSVLVFPGQKLDNDRQIAFSRRFGELEVMLKGVVGEDRHLAGISNVDPKTNQIIPADHPRMLRQYGNELWHTDSSFKPVSAKASLLHGREVPPSGGETHFAAMRAAWDDLPAEKKRLCERLVAEHSFVYSRRQVVKEDFLTPEEKAEVPPVPQALVVENPRNARKALYVASHAERILGWPEAQGRALLDELLAHATQPKYVYTHRWRPWDLVMWDNRATMHKGSAYDYRNHRRVMVRTTVAGDAPTITADEVRRREAEAATLAA